MARGHYASSDINYRVNELFQQWKELGVATDKKGVGLQEALSLVLFNRKVDGVQTLIRDRVAVAGSQETGRDLEHCKVLMRKFDDFEKVGSLKLKWCVCVCVWGGGGGGIRRDKTDCSIEFTLARLIIASLFSFAGASAHAQRVLSKIEYVIHSYMYFAPVLIKILLVKLVRNRGWYVCTEHTFFCIVVCQ